MSESGLVTVSEPRAHSDKFCLDGCYTSDARPTATAMSAMDLELHFPNNWSFEGTVDVLYVDATSGEERSYGSLAQGAYMTRQTYSGHVWNMRESSSRQLLMSVTADARNGALQLVTIGADGGLDPMREAVWRMGKAPREPLLRLLGREDRGRRHCCGWVCSLGCAVGVIDAHQKRRAIQWLLLMLCLRVLVRAGQCTRRTGAARRLNGLSRGPLRAATRNDKGTESSRRLIRCSASHL